MQILYPKYFKKQKIQYYKPSGHRSARVSAISNKPARLCNSNSLIKEEAQLFGLTTKQIFHIAVPH